MRLFFDARYIRTDFHDGISRYSAELAAAVHEAAPGRGVEVTYLIHDEAQRALLPERAQTLAMTAPTSWREPVAARLLNRFAPDVVFSPMQTLGARGRRYRLILTLHDTIYYRHRTPPRDLPAPIRLGWRLFHLSYVPQRLTLDAADVVATVSETSRRQFAAVRLTKRPVVVIPNAPQRLADLLPGGRDDVQADGPVRNLVYMGSFMPYKNVETLVRAMRLLPGRTLHLLSRIAPARRAELQALAGDAAVVFHNGVTDAAYAAALADHAVLASTSLDEGYGLPLAEALALGVPAVVTDMEIFHEVAGDGAVYVDPHDEKAVAAAVTSLDDDAVRAGVIAAGTAHIARYSWERSAGALLDTVTTLARG
ncbi:glycosyltransferase family 4 protein [Microbacterium sp. zg.Y909]|uniref:glycosyltransferase family 4 protein n=1 Tax=Microbacterium sp. zg.Y909 TaxID=2969413 RepID=UPI00214C1FF9|nr:glycosyltransferase family 1 protein [Microbacterium sp. zg.Y909]MCR2827468.1 glycosyltransferase family 4 protein [Microbacterium sp. zg.Y909]